MQDNNKQPQLRRALGPLQLMGIGVGAIIGAGIFVVTGHAAAAYAGPAVVLSFAIAGLGCLLAGLCYAELAAMMPVAGSAYTYTFATFGPLPAWIVGWNLVLEYLAAASTVAVGWSGYFAGFAGRLGITVTPALAAAPIAGHSANGIVVTGAICNLPAATLVAAVTVLVALGVRVSVKFNSAMVLLKLTIVLIVIAVGFPYMTATNHAPFIPANTGTFGSFGWSGILRATGVVFFAYIGFDAVAVLAQEARNPQRDVPIGILGAIFICSALYMLMSYVLTGLAPYASLAVPDPVAMAVIRANPAIGWLAPLINAGAVVGLASVVLVLLLAQSRVFYAMSLDGMIPPLFGRIHQRLRTPLAGTLISGAVAMLLAALVPLEILGELISIGTLAAFAFVCFAVLLLRIKAPGIARPFRTPCAYLVAPLGMATCLLMMAFLPLSTWLRLLAWTLIGLTIYFLYGIHHVRSPGRTLCRWKIAPAISGPTGS